MRNRREGFSEHQGVGDSEGNHSTSAMDEVHQEVGEVLMGDPRFAGGGVGEGIGVRYSVVFGDPASGGEVPPSVGGGDGSATDAEESEEEGKTEEKARVTRQTQITRGFDDGYLGGQGQMDSTVGLDVREGDRR